MPPTVGGSQQSTLSTNQHTHTDRHLHLRPVPTLATKVFIHKLIFYSPQFDLTLRSQVTTCLHNFDKLVFYVVGKHIELVHLQMDFRERPALSLGHVEVQEHGT